LPGLQVGTNARLFSNILKMVAYQIEGSLVELLRPVYPKTEEEGRTLIQAALRSVAMIESMNDELWLTLASLSSRIDQRQS
jgi:hypothetical protein